MLRSLHEAGHESRALDFGCLETLGFLAGAFPDFATGQDTIFLSYSMRQQLEDKLTDHVLKSVLAHGPLDFVLFMVEERASLSMCLSLAKALRQNRPAIRLVLAGAYAERYGMVLLNAAKVFDAVLMEEPESGVVAWAGCLHKEKCAAQLGNVALLGGKHTPRRAHWRKSPVLPLYDEAVYPTVHKGQFQHFEVPMSRLPASLACEASGLNHAPLWVNNAAQVQKEVESIAQESGSNALHFSGAFTPPGDSRDILAPFLGGEVPLYFSRDAHIHHVDSFSLNEWVRAGGRTVRFKVPSGSQRLIEDFYGENFGVGQVETVIRGCKDAGLFTVMHMQYPCPWDDYHTREETVRLLKRTQPDGVLFSAPELVPGSLWYQQAQLYGFKMNYKHFAAWVAASGKNASRDVAYRMRGWNARKYASECRLLLDACTALQVSVGMDAPLALAAQLSGFEKKEAAFLARFTHASNTLDADTLGELMHTFNAAAKEQKTADTLAEFTSYRIAVGN
jgi:hypothetical protein